MKVQKLCVFNIPKIPSQRNIQNPFGTEPNFKKNEEKMTKENMTKKLIRI